MNEEDYDDNGYHWECQGCADKFNTTVSEYRCISNCSLCEFAKKYVKKEESTNE